MRAQSNRLHTPLLVRSSVSRVPFYPCLQDADSLLWKEGDSCVGPRESGVPSVERRLPFPFRDMASFDNQRSCVFPIISLFENGLHSCPQVCYFSRRHVGLLIFLRPAVSRLWRFKQRLLNWMKTASSYVTNSMKALALPRAIYPREKWEITNMVCCDFPLLYVHGYKLPVQLRFV